MRRAVLAVVLTGACCLAAAMPAAAAVYRDGIQRGNTPFSYRDVSGKPSGFDVDAMNWIAETMGFTVEYTTLPADSLLPALQRGEVDMVCSGLRVTPGLLRQAALSRPYCIMQSVFAVRDGSGLTVSAIRNGGKLVGVQRASAQAQWLAREHAGGGANYTLQFYDYTTHLFEDLLAGKVDAVALVAERAEEAILDGKPVVIAGAFGPVDFLAVAVRPEDDALRLLLDEGFRKLKADPYWRELQKKYRVFGW